MAAWGFEVTAPADIKQALGMLQNEKPPGRCLEAEEGLGSIRMPPLAKPTWMEPQEEVLLSSPPPIVPRQAPRPYLELASLKDPASSTEANEQPKKQKPAQDKGAKKASFGRAHARKPQPEPQPPSSDDSSSESDGADNNEASSSHSQEARYIVWVSKHKVNRML